MSIRLMSLVFNYKFPKRVEYECLVYPFKRDKETKKILERSATPEVRKLATTGSSCKAVMLALADHANDDGKGAYPSVATLQIKTNLERPTVIGAVLALQYHLFINFVGESPKETNNYDISPERLVKPFDQGGKASLPVKVNPVYQGGKASLPESSITTLEPSEIDKTIFAALEKLMGALNSSVPRLVGTWTEKHPLEKILQAISMASEKGARSEKYVDKILIGWEANGYPRTREEQVDERRANGRKSRPAHPVQPELTGEELERARAEADRLFGVQS
jgi:DnaD/phage-associated family protein